MYKFEESLNNVNEFKIENEERDSISPIEYSNLTEFIKLEPQHDDHCTTEDLLTTGKKNSFIYDLKLLQIIRHFKV